MGGQNYTAQAEKESVSPVHGWVFIFNDYTNKWYASKRENYSDLFSYIDSDKVISSSEISTLVELINKTDGDLEKINALLK